MPGSFLEILAENLAAGVAGRRIEAIEVRQPALLQTAVPPESFAGEYLSLPVRRGKYIVLECESRRAIVLHLMRLGRLRPLAPSRAGVEARRRPQGSSARIVFDDGSALLLIEHGTEKRARLWLTDDPDALPELRSVRTRPDARRAGRARVSRVAAGGLAPAQDPPHRPARDRGIGNGLSDEILYEARLSPLQLTAKTSDEDGRRLFRRSARCSRGRRHSSAGRRPGSCPSGSRSSTTPCTTGRGPRARGAGARSLGSRTRTGRRSTARGARPEEALRPKALQVEMSPGASASGRRIAADTKG